LSVSSLISKGLINISDGVGNPLDLPKLRQGKQRMYFSYFKHQKYFHPTSEKSISLLPKILPITKETPTKENSQILSREEISERLSVIKQEVFHKMMLA